jgi:hypothetical protein
MPISLDPHSVLDRISTQCTTQNATTVAGMKHDSFKDDLIPQTEVRPLSADQK